MCHLRIVFIVLCLMLVPMAACASESADTKYSGLVSKVEHLSSTRIIAFADRLAAKGRGEEAMVLYTLVCNRFAESLPEGEKGQCALAHIKAGNKYFDLGNYVNGAVS